MAIFNKYIFANEYQVRNNFFAKNILPNKTNGGTRTTLTCCQLDCLSWGLEHSIVTKLLLTSKPPQSTAEKFLGEQKMFFLKQYKIT